MRNIEKAIARAVQLHTGQIRKGDSQTPVIVHPIEVAMIVSKFTNNEPVIIAALLHDTVEDCDYTVDQAKAEFDSEVAYYLTLLTEDKTIVDYKERKNSNLNLLRDSLSTTTHGYFIKAADTISNMRSLVATLREYGSEVWTKFNADKNDKIEYFKTILRDTRSMLPYDVFEEFVSLLKDLEYSETYEKKTMGFQRM